MPSFLQMSSTFMPASACLSALTICSSVYLLFRMSPILHGWAHVSPGPLSGGKVTMKTLWQLRAENALRWLRQNEAIIVERGLPYLAYVERLPAAIVTNGLGQAMATELAAAKPGGEGSSREAEAHRLLYEGVQQWLCRDGGVYSAKSSLLEAIVEGSQDDDLWAQVEALGWLEWHKKFCRAYLTKNGD